MAPVGPAEPVAPVVPVAPVSPVGPVGPTSPVVGPTQLPSASTTVVPFTVMLLGVMSPVTLLAIRAYGTLTRDWRGDISESVPMVTPRNRTEPSKTDASREATSPSWAEK